MDLFQRKVTACWMSDTVSRAIIVDVMFSGQTKRLRLYEF